ncbi:MAG: acyltransferase [Elusimicrobia bacterium]|nr:acyltransferase [Elusimicrobiota bacterium]
MSENKNINYTFKILYALGIIFVVAGHCNGGGFSIFYEFLPIYICFNLGLFMFSSGYFYNSENEYNIKKYIVKKLKHLILPLYLWNIFYAGLIFVIKNFDFFPYISVNLKTIFIDPILSGGQFALNLGGWFIIPLFVIHIINILVRKIFMLCKIRINEIIYFIISLIMGLLCVYISNRGFDADWFPILGRVLYFIPFYSLGILYRKYEKYDRLPSILYFSIVMSIIIFIMFLENGIPGVSPAECKFNNLNPLLPFVLGFLGIAFWLRIAKILEPAIGKNKYINIIADNTYSIMINRLLGFMIIKTLFACISKYFGYFNNFDMYEYKTNVLYCYFPNIFSQLLIIYLIAGIVFSVILQLIINKLIKNFIHKY